MAVVVPRIAIVSSSVAVSKDRTPKSRPDKKGNSSSDHAQFKVTVTAVVAVIAPLEPVTVTV
jgi:hypothetical protein